METITKPSEETQCTDCTMILDTLESIKDEDVEIIRTMFREEQERKITLGCADVILEDTKALIERNKSKLKATRLTRIIYKNDSETVLAIDEENFKILKAVKENPSDSFINISGYDVRDLLDNGYENEDIDDFKIDLDILVSTIIRVEFRQEGSTLKVLNNFFNKEK